MSSNSKIEWTDATWNPVTGCTKVSPGCDHCLAPETRVLCADMSWRPIGELVVGDRVIAFTDEPAIGVNRKIEIATVEATWRVEAPTVEIRAGGHLVIASDTHKWLTDHPRPWRYTRNLRLGNVIRSLGSPDRATAAAWPKESPGEQEDYRYGYIAGVTAGDGTFRWDPSGGVQSYWRVAVLATDHPVLDRLRDYLARYGITVEVKPFDNGGGAPMLKVETRRRGWLAALDALLNPTAPRRETRAWMAGWLAGIFDTDGMYDRNLRVSQRKPNGVLETVERYATALGFTFKIEEWEHACPTARLVGDVSERIDFLTAIQPALSRKTTDMIGRLLESRPAEITSLVRGPVRELVDIQTSTGTFVAEGLCTHNCYAETFAELWRGTAGHHFERVFDVTLRWERMEQPRTWKKPRRIFVNSMSDVFHEAVPDDFILAMFAVMAVTPQHQYQVLTKRHGRMRSLLSREKFSEDVKALTWQLDGGLAWRRHHWPLPNVWLGVSAENQQWADIRIPALLNTPAAIRWVSAEPLLGPVQLAPGWLTQLRSVRTGLDWLVVGGESGAGARPMRPEWARALRDQCGSASVPFFFKQWGSHRWVEHSRYDDATQCWVADGIEPQRVSKKLAGRELDGRTWDEYPEAYVSLLARAAMNARPRTRARAS